MAEFKPRWLATALLSLRSNPPPSLLAAFALGLLIFSLIGNFISNWISDPSSITADSLGRLAVALFILLFGAVAAVANYWSGLNDNARVSELSTVTPKQIVITALSPFQEFRDREGNITGNNLENVVRLMRHHKDVIHAMYLISTYEHDDKGGVAAAYERLMDEARKLMGASFRDDLLQKVDIESEQSAEFVFQQMLAKFDSDRIPADQTVIDITAGTKPLSVGLTLIGMAKGATISYQAIPRDESGQPMTKDKAVLSHLWTDLLVITPPTKPTGKTDKSA